jgi:N-acetylglucosaminyl-diphospho-decaprenol L-rhamnosyltransferase
MVAGGRSRPFPLVADWPKARAVLQTAWKQFGIVLIDKLPILAASGALLLAGIAESVLLDVRAGSADRNEARRAKEQLDQTGTPVIRRRAEPMQSENPWPAEPALSRLLPRRPEMSAGMEQATKRKPEGESQAEVAIILTIIIPSYNTRELLSDCLGSIYQNPPCEPYEIIVVDDASKDGTSEMAGACFPEVRLLRNETNRHYAFSNNWAFSIARGQYLLLLNSDTIVLPQALDGMVAFLQKHPEAGVVGCRLLNGDGTVQWSVKSLPNAGSALFGARSIVTRMFPNNRYSRMHLLHLGRDMTAPFLVESGYVSSAAFMVPRAVADKVGNLDLRLAYHVDADYCKRIADAGYKCYYLPTATIIHLDHKGGTKANLRTRFRSLRMFEVHSYIYYRKHIQRSMWNRIFVPLGLFCHFLILITAQACAELAATLRSILRPKAPGR